VPNIKDSCLQCQALISPVYPGIVHQEMIEKEKCRRKANIKRTAYLYVYADSGSYQMTLFSETAEGIYTGTGAGTIPGELDTDEGILTLANGWPIHTPDTRLILMLTGKFKVKLTKDYNLKKATFTTLGVTISPTTFDSVANNFLFGKPKVKVKMIDEEDLPAGVPLP